MISHRHSTKGEPNLTYTFLWLAEMFHIFEAQIGGGGQNKTCGANIMKVGVWNYADPLSFHEFMNVIFRLRHSDTQTITKFASGTLNVLGGRTCSYNRPCDYPASYPGAFFVKRILYLIQCCIYRSVPKFASARLSVYDWVQRQIGLCGLPGR